MYARHKKNVQQRKWPEIIYNFQNIHLKHAYVYMNSIEH